MTDSILDSVKPVCNVEVSDTDFDSQLIMHINSVLFEVRQLGVNGVFSITSNSETWHDFLGDDIEKLELVKSYVSLKVKKIFDPPTVGAVATALDDLLKEYAFRLNVEVDPGEE